jgi:histidinol phosphatase-like PHP family hydrolase
MNILKKKLYYKFLDLQRLSRFTGEVILCNFANSVLTKIKNISDDKFEVELNKSIFTDKEKVFIDEYIATGHIQFIEDKIASLPKWVWLLIMPEYIPIEELKFIFNKYQISSKTNLIAYFHSDAAVNRYGEDIANLYCYFVENQDSKNFPLQYRSKPSEQTQLIELYCNEIILGNFHNHTTFSDGRLSIEALANLAKLHNRKFIGISDHSSSVGGVDAEKIINQISIINSLSNDTNFTILKSLECEILADGSLDMDCAIFKELDYLIIGAHRNEIMSKKEATRRLIRAVENPNSNILAHPQSRIYQKKVGLYLDIHMIIDACRENSVVIEINGDPDRLDLSPEHIEYAVKKGIIFSLDSDTHTLNSFKNINNAIKIAEAAHIPPEQVLNIQPMPKLKSIFDKVIY